MSATFLQEYRRIPQLNASISQDLISNLSEYCAMFETKNQHSEALNSPLLGVTPIYFTTTDRSILFTLLQVEEQDITNVIDAVPGIEPNWVVARDEYNQLILWVAHRIITSNLSKQQIEKGLMAVFKLLHYKFFTSIVFNSYKHGADKATMEAVIGSLSNKYDIIREKTWKGVIEARCRDIFAEESIHLKTLIEFNDDGDVLYLLSDIQTRIRQKIRLVTEQYYNMKEQGQGIGTYGTVDEVDGEKIVTAQSNIFDTMVEGMIVQCQTPARFLDNELISVLCARFQYVSEEMLRQVLTMFSELAALQAGSGELFKIKSKKGEDYYVGIGLMVREIIQKTYRLCILDKIDMNSKTAIIVKTLNLYTSSRITDESILTIKRSLLSFVVDCKKSSREATNSSIVIAIVLYVMIRSFDFIK